MILARFIDVIRDRTRLRMNARTDEALRKVAARRAAELGMSLDAYTDHVASCAPGSGELELVVRELTVAESYFFRGDRHFTTIRDELLPELLSRRRDGERRYLRVLSAGCAAGEEPYSIAIALKELLGDVSAWKISIVGVDLDARCLRRAAAARYGEWSLRDVPEALRRRYFEADQRGYRLRQDVASMVRFLRANLAVDDLRQMGIDQMDLVVCQNVLYYFEREVRELTATKLARSLRPGGWLLFGPADLSNERVGLCEAVSMGEVLVHRRLPDEDGVASERR
jgi:chemotaxis protein methyltransferase CheR